MAEFFFSKLFVEDRKKEKKGGIGKTLNLYYLDLCPIYLLQYRRVSCLEQCLLWENCFCISLST